MSGRRLQDEAALSLTAKRVLRGEDFIWSVILSFEERHVEWSVGMIDAETNCKGREVAAYVRKLVKGGIAGVPTVGADRTRFHRLIKKPAEAPRLRADGTPIGLSQQQRMWNAMRTLPRFDVRELAYTASTPEQKVKEAAAQRYVELLCGGGYLIVVRPRKGKHDLNVWRLKPGMNTGPLSPALCNVTAIYDRNLETIICDGAAEVAA